MSPSARNADPADPKGSRSTQILVALIALTGTLLVGYWQYGRAKADSPSARHQLTGRVLDAVSNHALAHAKVMLESEDVPPVQYTDSEGIFTFPVPPAAPYVRLKVELSGYEAADRRIDPSTLREAQEVRLQPLAAAPPPALSGTPLGSGGRSPDEATRDFVLGRWQVEQAAGQASSGTVMDFQADGTVTGSATQFINGFGRKVPLAGRWSFEALSANTFRMALELQNQPQQQATFKIIDHNHIHNIDQNYVAVRVE